MWENGFLVLVSIGKTNDIANLSKFKRKRLISIIHYLGNYRLEANKNLVYKLKAMNWTTQNEL